MTFRAIMCSIAIAALPTLTLAGDTAAPEDAFVYFINLEDGQTVSSPVRILFGLSGMGVAPAGTEKENTGHHHLLINRPPMGEGEEDELEFGHPRG